MIKNMQRGYRHKPAYPRSSTDPPPNEDNHKPEHTKIKLLKTNKQEQFFINQNTPKSNC